MYTYLDGDKVGASLNNLFEQGRGKEASLLSDNISRAIVEIGRYIRTERNIRLVLAGGDDVLFHCDEENLASSCITRVQDIFCGYTGLNMSYGTGPTVQSALQNLHHAKNNEESTIFKSDDSLISDILNKERRTDLRIIAGSKVPDLYINIIGHNIAHYPIDSVKLYLISEDPGKNDTILYELKDLKAAIAKQLALIVRSKYKKRLDNGEFEEVDLRLVKPQKQRYEEIARIDIQYDVIPYDDLDQTITRWVSGDEPKQQIIDVSGTLKDKLIDVYSICRFRDVESIFSFELRNDTRSYDEKELIHNLTSKKSYTYNCLANSNYTAGTTVVNELAVEKHSELLRSQDDISVQKKSFESLKSGIAEEQSKRLCVTAIVLFGIVLLGSYISIYLHPDGWGFVEPIRYIVSSLFGFLILVVGMIAPFREGRVTFFGVYEWLKEKRLEKLNEKYKN